MRYLAALCLTLLACTSPVACSSSPVSGRGADSDRSFRYSVYTEATLPTVLIECPGGGTGSGVVISQGRTEALILTAAHVVVDQFGEPQPVAVLRNDQITGKVTMTGGKPVRVNQHLDLAVIRTKAVWPAVGRVVAPSDYSEFGLYSKCLAYGHGLGTTDGSLTEGRIQDLDDHGFVRITAPVIFGNSGCGIWVESRGHWVLLGILQRCYTAGGSAVTHMGMASRPDTMLRFLKGLY